MNCACGKEVLEGSSSCPSCERGEDRPRPFIGCLARVIAWTLTALALRAAFAGGWLLRLADGAFGYVFGRSPSSVAASAWAVFVVVSMMAVLAHGLLGDRVPVLASYGRFLAWLGRSVAAVAAGFARLVWRAVEGGTERSGKGGRGGGR